MPDDETDRPLTNGNHANGDVERNGDGPQYDGNPNSPRLRMAAIIEDFSFLWFTISMNTGILSVLMHQLPYQVRQESTIASDKGLTDVS